MLKHRAVADLKDVLEVCFVAARPRLGEGHVTHAAGHFREVLARHFRVGLPGHAVILEETVEFGIIHGLPAEQVDGGFADDPDVLGRIECSSHPFFLRVDSSQ